MARVTVCDFSTLHAGSEEASPGPALAWRSAPTAKERCCVRTGRAKADTSRSTASPRPAPDGRATGSVARVSAA
eukprot:scaffold5277_cov404-Prasinococcus_capsulatus_cf.AAC.5